MDDRGTPHGAPRRGSVAVGRRGGPRRHTIRVADARRVGSRPGSAEGGTCWSMVVRSRGDRSSGRTSVSSAPGQRESRSRSAWPRSRGCASCCSRAAASRSSRAPSRSRAARRWACRTTRSTRRASACWVGPASHGAVSAPPWNARRWRRGRGWGSTAGPSVPGPSTPTIPRPSGGAAWTRPSRLATSQHTTCAGTPGRSTRTRSSRSSSSSPGRCGSASRTATS